jgi:hypothetical protein
MAANIHTSCQGTHPARLNSWHIWKYLRDSISDTACKLILAVQQLLLVSCLQGLMTFFTGGVESVSNNGEADAQKFFARLRPLEGRLKTAAASATNPSGAKFTR